MIPIPFQGQSVTLQKPQNLTDEECGPLPIRREGDVCISCWSMSWRERFKSLFTGKVWVGVLSGRTQPPIYTAIDRPFCIPGGGQRLSLSLTERVVNHFKGVTANCRREKS